MAEIGRVLDTSAMLAYARGSRVVGEELALAADDSLDVLLPALCLAEAYRQINDDGWHYLDVLATLPNVVVAPVEHGHCAVMGGWARVVGGMDLAQAAIETAANPIVPLVTAHRELLTRILPKEWPIIDLS